MKSCISVSPHRDRCAAVFAERPKARMLIETSTEREWIIRYDLSKAFSCITLNFEHARTHKSHLHYQLWGNRD